MSLLVEFDVAEYTECHEEDECGIEKDQTSLADMRVIEENEA